MELRHLRVTLLRPLPVLLRRPRAEQAANLPRIPVPALPPLSSFPEAGGSAVSSPSPSAPGTLYLVSLPIGNAEDISLRALRLLRTATLIVAEDIRLARRRLIELDSAVELLSLRPRFGVPAQTRLLETIAAGQDAVLIADAGTPCLAEPGLLLVQAVLAMGGGVTAVPGASAALAALVVSGFPTVPFTCWGFLPRRNEASEPLLRRIADSEVTSIVYTHSQELTHFLAALLRYSSADKKIVVACNLTRQTEDVFRGTLLEALEKFRPLVAVGEYTIVIDGPPPSASERSTL